MRCFSIARRVAASTGVSSSSLLLITTAVEGDDSCVSLMRKRKGRLESSDNDDVVDRDANPLPLLAPEGVNASDDGRDKQRMHPTTERNIIRRIAVVNISS